MAKRLLDIVVSLMALLVLAPLLGAVALLVRLSSTGPALFRQTRVGRNGRDFTLLKFRTMTTQPGSEQGSFDAGSNRRVTRAGKILRATKIDELPQLWNVLLGDMSLVGPRPEVRPWVEAYPDRWAEVLTVRPGITDNASILFRNEEDILAAADDPDRAYRNDVLPRKLELYQQYVRHHSVPGDIAILVRTVFAVLLPGKSNAESRYQSQEVKTMPDTSRTPVAVIPLEEAHLPSAVEVHLRAFPGFFLSFLGPRFLRLFYGSFLEDEAGIGFTAMDNENRLLGVVVGPLSPEGYFKRLIKRRWWAFFLASLTAIIKKPSTIRRLFRALFYRGEAPESDRPRSLLSSIAVSPDAQGLGVGGSLVRAWCGEAEQRGSAGAFLTTDADDNEAVNRFYQKLGWQIETTFVTPEGRRMNRYIIDFDPPSAESSSPS